MSEQRVQEVTELIGKRVIVDVEGEGIYAGVLTDVSPSGEYIVFDEHRVFRREDVRKHEVLADWSLPLAERAPSLVKHSRAREVLKPAAETQPFPKR